MNLFFIGNGSNNTTMVNVRQDILLRRIMTQRWIWIGIIQTIWTFGVMVEKTLQWSKIIVTNPTF
jgi:magnesium-transporting ATPase (P-type)